MSRAIVDSIEDEYHRYKALAEGAFAQVSDEELCAFEDDTSNAIVAIVWHLAGNLASRFEDFRTSDGEKPWRNREEEFDARSVTGEEMLAKWHRGWSALFAALADLTDADLGATVTIRRQPLRIDQALHRSLAHAAYHVGQIVYVAKALRGAAWKSLSIPRGGSAAYNEAPDKELPGRHTAALRTNL